MKSLLKKDIKLWLHPTAFIFLFMGAMLLIPSYPYYVPFFYVCLSIFFTFLSDRENNDTVFSMLMPVRKRDAVLAKCIIIAIIELASLLISIPFAIIGVRINPTGGNAVGIESNVAFYGLVLVMFAIFNNVFITRFYKTAYKVGSSFGWACAAMGAYIIIAEAAVHVPVPALTAYLDTTDAAMQIRQLPVLAAGAVIFIISLLLTAKRGGDSFEAVDL